ncbi:MAG: mycofactocin-coupled SDR family oxidoreductase [Nitrososphaera sp.]|nr:mycofactocin-coupled SDR family oxidoreductase [Nitrososphaera sp.]
MGKLDNKVALVTGAARGQGRSHCLALAKEGAHIAALDICRDLSAMSYTLGTRKELAEVAEQVTTLGREAFVVEADISKGDETGAAIEAVIARFSRIDILINNACIGAGMAPAHQVSEEIWDMMLAVNLKGVWLCCKYVIPYMIKRKSGKIVNVASIAGLKALANGAPYIAAKHGVIGLTKTLAIELAPYNINVNAVCPGTVDTEMFRALARELGLTTDAAVEQFTQHNLFPGLIPAEDISRAVVWLASDDSRFVTGHALPVDAGWLAK